MIIDPYGSVFYQLDLLHSSTISSLSSHIPSISDSVKYQRRRLRQRGGYKVSWGDVHLVVLHCTPRQTIVVSWRVLILLHSVVVASIEAVPLSFGIDFRATIIAACKFNAGLRLLLLFSGLLVHRQNDVKSLRASFLKKLSVNFALIIWSEVKMLQASWARTTLYASKLFNAHIISSYTYSFFVGVIIP